jgi:hypothetical protein
MQETTFVTQATGVTWVFIVLIAAMAFVAVGWLLARRPGAIALIRTAGLGALVVLLIVGTSITAVRTYRVANDTTSITQQIVSYSEVDIEQMADQYVPRPIASEPLNGDESGAASANAPHNMETSIRTADFETLPPGYFGVKAFTGGAQQLVLIGDWGEAMEPSSLFAASEDKKLRMRLIKILAAAYERVKRESVAVMDQNHGEPLRPRFLINPQEEQVGDVKEWPPIDVCQKFSIRSLTGHKSIIVGEDQPITSHVSRQIWVVDIPADALSELAERVRGSLRTANEFGFERRGILVGCGFFVMSGLLWLAGVILRRAAVNRHLGSEHG